MCDTKFHENQLSVRRSQPSTLPRTGVGRATHCLMSAWLVRIGIRRIAWLLCVGVAVSFALAWVSSVKFANERLDRYVAQETSQARNDALLTSANLNQRLNQAVSIALTLALDQAMVAALARFGPGIQASTLPRPERSAVWLADPALKVISERMQRTVERFDLHSLQLVNAAGDTVAEGHGTGIPPFIGTNYADRDYFKAAQKGLTGQQFLLGRVTNVFALGFSAPVHIEGEFVGMVGSGLVVPQLSSSIENVHAVVTDDLGVIVLAKDPALLMHTMPGATVNTLTAEARDKRYKQSHFDPVDISPMSTGGAHTVYQWREESRPFVMQSQATSNGALRVHVLRDLEEPYTYSRTDQVSRFGLVSMLVLVSAALLGVAAQFMISKQTQQDALLRLNAALAREANTDALTGCANRRNFMQRLEQERDRSVRYSFDMCVLSLDIDHFKLVNDTHGHAAGDEVLKHFVAIIQGNLRQADLLGRVGGEEFCIVLPQTAAEGGAMMAERIRVAVEAAPAVFGAIFIGTTVSVGGVHCPSGSFQEINRMLNLADGALYRAKHGGRNRIEWVSLPPGSDGQSLPETA